VSDADTLPADDQHPGAGAYALLCLGALTVMVLALVLRRPDPWALLPALVGGLALLFRWRGGPLFVLLSAVVLLWTWWDGVNPGWLLFVVVAWVWRLLFSSGVGYPRLPGASHLSSRALLPVSDLLLAVSLLAYAAGHFRLQGLVGRLFPPDPRRRREAAPRGPRGAARAGAAQRRSPQLVTVGEVVGLLVVVAACGGLACLFWSWLRRRETDLEIADTAWQGILVLWLLGGGVLAGAGLLRYLGRRRMTAPEAELYLQDVLWQETRGEQRRLNRWLAWAWLRRRREEGGQS
jgi:hypothetical protein